MALITKEEVIFITYHPKRGKDIEKCQAGIPGCDNPSTQKAVVGIHKVACCDDEKCAEQAASMALTMANQGQRK